MRLFRLSRGWYWSTLGGIIIISHFVIRMSQFREFLKKVVESQKRVMDYWRKTPTSKIILLNTGIYVPPLSPSASGSSK